MNRVMAVPYHMSSILCRAFEVNLRDEATDSRTKETDALPGCGRFMPAFVTSFFSLR
jgi:hypothetical protein